MTDIEQKIDNLWIHWKEIAHNKTRRTLICLCVDASASMSRDRRMETVNREIHQFLKNMDGNILARDGLEVCVVTFGNQAQVNCDFGPPSQAIQANLTIAPTGSLSELGAGVSMALERLDDRQRLLSSMGNSFYIPWLILISDGEATDESRCQAVSQAVKQKIRDGELKVKCLSLGGEEDGSKTLQGFTLDGQVERVDSLEISDFFAMLSRSVSKASQQNIQLDMSRND